MNHDRERWPKTRKPLRHAEPRPRLNQVEAIRIIEAIGCSDVSGLQTRALVSLMFYNHLRLGQALELKCGDVDLQGPHPSLVISTQRIPARQKDKFPVPCSQQALDALVAYIEKANLGSDQQDPVFRFVDQRTGEVTSKPLSSRAAQLFINREARRAGIEREVSPHEFRVAGARLLKEQLESL